jgi:hypothetical protein
VVAKARLKPALLSAFLLSKVRAATSEFFDICVKLIERAVKYLLMGKKHVLECCVIMPDIDRGRRLAVPTLIFSALVGIAGCVVQRKTTANVGRAQ